MKALTDLKIIVSTGDDLSLRRAITYFLNNIAKQTKEQETIAAIGEDIFAVALDQPFRFGCIRVHQAVCMHISGQITLERQDAPSYHDQDSTSITNIVVVTHSSHTTVKAYAYELRPCQEFRIQQIRCQLVSS